MVKLLLKAIHFTGASEMVTSEIVSLLPHITLCCVFFPDADTHCLVLFPVNAAFLSSPSRVVS